MLKVLYENWLLKSICNGTKDIKELTYIFNMYEGVELNVQLYKILRKL
mgnify:CR=1 FL=1